MLGQLPRTLEVDGVPYDIRADWQNILTIIAAYHDRALKDEERAFVCLRRMYPAFASMPPSAYPAAFEAATRFMECNEDRDKPGPRLVDWEKDEQLIFPALNAAAGFEVRERPALHWWTFLGYFQSIDPESLWGTVLCIRHKMARHKKLEKHERAFYHANRAMVELYTPAQKKQNLDDFAREIQRELLERQRNEVNGSGGTI